MRRSSKHVAYMCGLLVLLLTACVVWLAPSSPKGSIDPQVSATGPIALSTSSKNGATGNETGDETASHPLDPVLKIAYESREVFQKSINDYRGVLVKRERIGGTLSGETRMEIKVRSRRSEGDKLVRPLHAYLKFVEPWLSRGREVIWVENRNEGKLIGHEGGFKNLVRVALAPTDSLAMMGNKYPITEIGLANLVEKLIEKGERDKKNGRCLVIVEEGHKIGDRVCKLIQVTHPERDPRFDFHIAQIFMDPERMIPLRYAAFLWPEKLGDAPPLEEEYTYLNVELNVGLQDIEFDPENPAYNYPR